MTPLEDPDGAATWWRHAVIYQVYIRSFADGSGDGIGDIAGIRERLGHLADLGVDAIWINPWYPSPMADAGYDVADHRAIEPSFGTLDDAVALFDDCHRSGVRVLLDLVPNHVSSTHRWFADALAATPGSPQRDRFVFRDGVGVDGSEPPNNWKSEFGGPAWTRVIEPDGRPGQWYLHLFAPEQPDLNWSNPAVAADVEETLRFWFDRGVDGFRIDVAHSLVKADGLPDVDDESIHGRHPHWDQPGVHDIYRRWRTIAESYDPPRVFVAEAWVAEPDRLAAYVRSDELHTAFNFEFLVAPWSAGALRRCIDDTVREHEIVGAPPTWVLSNHDVARHVSRYARPAGVEGYRYLDDLLGLPCDLELGTRRARAAALLVLALPGGAYIYQGDELGLPEVEDLAEEVLADPFWIRSGRQRRGRDGCRVPLPWEGEHPPFGFSPPGAMSDPWLPQPPAWSERTVARQHGDPSSMLELYRAALRIRRQHPAFGDGPMTWRPSPADALVFERDPGLVVAVNLGTAPMALPGHKEVLLASGELPAGGLAPDSGVWLAI